MPSCKRFQSRPKNWEIEYKVTSELLLLTLVEIKNKAICTGFDSHAVIPGSQGSELPRTSFTHLLHLFSAGVVNNSIFNVQLIWRLFSPYLEGNNHWHSNKIATCWLAHTSYSDFRAALHRHCLISIVFLFLSPENFLALVMPQLKA